MTILKQFKHIVNKILYEDSRTPDDSRLIAPSRHQLKRMISLGEERDSFGKGKPLVNIHFLLDMIDALPNAKLLYDKDMPVIYFSSNMGEGILLGIKPKSD